MGEVSEAEQIADAVANAINSVSVAYSHGTTTDFRTVDRMWRVHETGGNPFEKNEWIGEFDNKDEANALCVKFRRERAIATVEAATADLRERLAEVEGALRECRDALANSGAESGYCMCGDPVDSHNIGSGHSPVDSHVYYATQLLSKIDALLGEPK